MRLVISLALLLSCLVGLYSLISDNTDNSVAVEESKYPDSTIQSMTSVYTLSLSHDLAKEKFPELSEHYTGLVEIVDEHLPDVKGRLKNSLQEKLSREDYQNALISIEAKSRLLTGHYNDIETYVRDLVYRDILYKTVEFHQKSLPEESRKHLAKLALSYLEDYGDSSMNTPLDGSDTPSSWHAFTSSPYSTVFFVDTNSLSSEKDVELREHLVDHLISSGMSLPEPVTEEDSLNTLDTIAGCFIPHFHQGRKIETDSYCFSSMLESYFSGDSGEQMAFGYARKETFKPVAEEDETAFKFFTPRSLRLFYQYDIEEDGAEKSFISKVIDAFSFKAELKPIPLALWGKIYDNSDQLLALGYSKTPRTYFSHMGKKEQRDLVRGLGFDSKMADGAIFTKIYKDVFKIDVLSEESDVNIANSIYVVPFDDFAVYFTCSTPKVSLETWREEHASADDMCLHIAQTAKLATSKAEQ